MIVGNGLLANGFSNKTFNHKNLIIFASGVSDSKNDDDHEFNREKQLILKTLLENSNLKIIYFSSILSGVNNTPYYNHKLEMENLIKEKSQNYLIFKVPQIVGKMGNKNNLFNHLKQSLLDNKEIIIFKDTYRSIIDIEDLVNIVDYCKDKVNNQILNVSYIDKIMVLDILKNISSVLSIPANFKLVVGSNNNWNIENSDIVNESIKNLKIDKKYYTNKIIKKYIN